MSTILAYTLVLLVGGAAAFFCGSIPFAIAVGKVMYGVDVREHGSGNIGATNVARTLGAGPGIAVMLLDAAKGALAVLIMMGILRLGAIVSDALLPIFSSGWLYDVALLFAAMCAILGHMFSPFTDFHGGKGSSTAFGSVLLIMPWAAVIAFALFALASLVTRYVSIGSICAAISLPISTILLYSTSVSYLVFSFAVCILVLIAHKGNINRLIHHTEPRFSFGDSDAAEEPYADDDSHGSKAETVCDDDTCGQHDESLPEDGGIR